MNAMYGTVGPDRDPIHACVCMFVWVCCSSRFQKLYSIFRPEYTWWRLVLLYVERPVLHVLLTHNRL